MKVVKARLFELKQEELEQSRLDEVGAKADNAWGGQIRSYVLHPYQMVKDLRTNHETSNTQAVLDGDLDAFIDAYLKMKR